MMLNTDDLLDTAMADLLAIEQKYACGEDVKQLPPPPLRLLTFDPEEDDEQEEGN